MEVDLFSNLEPAERQVSIYLISNKFFFKHKQLKSNLCNVTGVSKEKGGEIYVFLDDNV